MAQDSQIYRFFIDDDSAQFLFKKRIIKNFRPKVGDSISDGLGNDWKVMRDVIPNETGAARVTHNGFVRITHDLRLRIVGAFVSNEDATHNYYVQPANKADRVSTWTTSNFANDRTQDQLFNSRWE